MVLPKCYDSGNHEQIVPAHAPTQTEKVMKALYVRKLFLWPRFHMAVRGALEKEGAGADVRFNLALVSDQGLASVSCDPVVTFPLCGLGLRAPWLCRKTVGKEAAHVDVCIDDALPLFAFIPGLPIERTFQVYECIIILNLRTVCPLGLQLIELALPMSEAMTTIYHAIVELLGACIKVRFCWHCT